jgi:hypothetical protein
MEPDIERASVPGAWINEDLLHHLEHRKSIFLGVITIRLRN